MRSSGGCKCTILSPKGDNTICPLFSLALPLKPGNCIKMILTNWIAHTGNVPKK